MVKRTRNPVFRGFPLAFPDTHITWWEIPGAPREMMPWIKLRLDPETARPYLSLGYDPAKHAGLPFPEWAEPVLLFTAARAIMRIDGITGLELEALRASDGRLVPFPRGRRSRSPGAVDAAQRLLDRWQELQDLHFREEAVPAKRSGKRSSYPDDMRATLAARACGIHRRGVPWNKITSLGPSGVTLYRWHRALEKCSSCETI
jgi:hypothetical protein